VDWVILSACITAAGSDANAEALSSLARGFAICPGAGAAHVALGGGLDATIKLIASAVREVARDGSVGRAEAAPGDAGHDQ
jgi:hypothetical protein